MSDKGMDELGKLLASDPELQKAALSGMQKAVQEQINSKNLRVSTEAMQSLGQMAALPSGNPVADDYVARVASSVIAVVKTKVIDLAHDMAQLHEIQNRINDKIGGMNLNINNKIGR
ncbi:hypothetical protein FE784_26570 [Paenibacillus hemerocallicola]|jgi:hypothetical protein|uniref:Uncharacterized protein n=1 Tax=Paenibacillus hemerocallicola TaxID=1172614 RepID=A0A5C4T2E8_9BACL|nr:hypothetical protein [Paenibacillus hemerocallicola]TNJ63231.1 hypothetical protein FE784_26570 [Paenibacillus hemerocallicola]